MMDHNVPRIIPAKLQKWQWCLMISSIYSTFTCSTFGSYTGEKVNQFVYSIDQIIPLLNDRGQTVWWC